MALAAKLLVGALFLGAGSTVTYVACTGGFGAGGNGTETEARGGTQVAASPAPSSSSGPQVVPDAEQEQLTGPGGSAGTQIPSAGVGAQGQPAGPAVDSSHNADASREAQIQPGVTGEDTDATRGQPQIAAEGGGESGVSASGQGTTTDGEQGPEVGSSQSLTAGSSENANKNEKPQDVDGGHETIDGDASVNSGNGSKPETKASGEHSNTVTGGVQEPENQSAEVQLAEQSGTGGNTSGKEVTSPSVTDQESTNPGATLQSN